ncbi:MAG: TQO small subunit DoxD [Candidatus Tumulicola sp.]
MKPLPSSSRYAAWLALVRILTGLMWLSHGVPKFTQSAAFMPPNGFMAMYVAHGLQTSAEPYHTFLATVVAPNLALFAELVRLGEVLVGLLLLLGALTRLGGLGGVLLTLNYISARGHLLSTTSFQSLDFGLLVLSLISLGLPTGRFFGVDALLARAKRAPPVRAQFVEEPPLKGPTAPPNA